MTIETMTASLSSTLKSINPASLEVLGEAAVTPNIDIAKAGQLSRQSFESWHKTKLKDRLKKIETFHQLLASKQDEIARLITLEVGKPLVESYAGELSGPLDTCLWLIKNAEKILADQQVTINNPLLFGKTHVLKFDPAGLIGIISPWNYPFSIPVMTILMALVAGNTVILKPSEKSPLTGLKIGELFREAGFPKNAVTVITGAGVAGQAVANLDLARLIFTGSIATGQKVMHSAASSLIRITLELGGKDAAIVLPDAPVERTARAITWGAFTNAGQACASIERLYLVRSSNNDALLKRLVELASKLKMGDPLLETTELGPLIDVQQYEHVVNQVEEAIAGGAKVLCGAGKLSSLAVNTTGEKKLAGYFYEPTIITDVNKSMKIMQDETFGPVLPVVMVDSPEEAIALANDSKFGLTASVWSADIEQAQKVADKLEVGSVFINDCLYTHARPELPWSGLKKSGFGCSHSQFGLLDLVNIKQIAIDRSPWHRLWWYPYGATKLKAIRTGLQLLHDQKQNKGAASAAKLFEFISSLLSLK